MKSYFINLSKIEKITKTFITMKNLLFTFCFAFLGLALAINTTAQTTPAPDQQAVDPNGPILTFDSDTVDYGTIEQGSDPFRTVYFTNTGKKPLIIMSCKGSCGCTAPNCDKYTGNNGKQIMPGERGEFKVRYDTKRIGNVRKTVTVKSNSIEGTVTLKVFVNVTAVKTEPAIPPKTTGPVVGQ